jgi:alkanesulfonate monooxygenase SsuD/methylene tetrahydromethanopterin reductase-like flavin-dependent oxidoreductase (luciferase family)
VGVNIVLGETEADADRKAEDLFSYRDTEGYLAFFGGGSGIDIAKVAPDEVVRFTRRGHVESFEEEYAKRTEDHGAGAIFESLANPRQDEFFVSGTPEQVADRLEEIIETTDVDGFNVIQYLSPGTFTDIVDLLVPELQHRGMYRTSYPEGTLRERLFPGVGPLLPETHPATRHRGQFAKSSATTGLEQGSLAAR